MSEPEPRAAERVLYHDGAVTITTAAVRTPGTTYAVAHVIAARVEYLPARHWMPRRRGPFTIFGVCVAAGIAGIMGHIREELPPRECGTLILFSVVGMILTVWLWGTEPAGHHLVLVTAAGERPVLMRDAEGARQALAAVRAALGERR